MTPAKRRAKGDGSLFKRADGIWIGVVELPVGADGKRRRKRVASKDRNEAIRKLKKLRAEVDAGKIAVTSSATVEQWLNRWLPEIHRRKVRPGTYEGYERIIRLHVVPHIGHRRLDKLTAAHIRQMHDAIWSTRSAQLAHVILQKALTDAEREGMVNKNVALLVDKPTHVAATRGALSVNEAKQLLRSAIDTHDPWATRWAAALLLGARQGELLGLQWSRVDLDAGTADLSRQIQVINPVHGCERHSDGTWSCGHKRPGACPQHRWNIRRGFDHEQLHESLFLTPPKTTGRVVPIPAPLWAMLEAHYKSIRESPNPHNLVWHHGDGRPVSRYEDYDNWQAALKTAGLPPAPLHVARHTTATLLAIAGVPESVGMAILGHASARYTAAMHTTACRCPARTWTGHSTNC